MNNFLIRNFTAILFAIVLVGVAFMVWKIDKTSAELKMANENIAELKRIQKSIDEGVISLSEDRVESQKRVIRVEREIRYVQDIPSKTVCGAPVHAAIDLMRDREGADSTK